MKQITRGDWPFVFFSWLTGGSDRHRTSSSHSAVDREPLKQITRGDWLFIFFSWLTAGWAVFIVADEIDEAGVIGLDVLPALAGVSIVSAGWPAVRFKERVLSAINGLRDGAALDETGDIGAFRAALRRRVLWTSVLSGVAIALGMAVYLLWAVNTGHIEPPEGQAFFVVLLLTVSVGAGLVTGFLLGRMLGYGQVLQVMRSAGIVLTRIDTPQARSAMHVMEGVLRYAVFVTLGMCCWFAAWFAAWLVELDPRDYENDYWVLFICLWFISLAFYWLAARTPALAFRRRFEDLSGGPDAIAARERQLAEARDDRARLQETKLNDRSTFEDVVELDALIEELQARCAPSRIPPRWLLDLIAVGMFALAVGSLALGLTGAFDN